MLSINRNLCNVVFGNSSPFLPIILTSFVTETEKTLHFLLFSPRQLNSPLNYLVSFFMIK